jgi:hypothetical protein
MMYLAGRGIIAARIKKRVNWKRKPGRPSLFDYDTYSKVRSSSVERFLGWLKSFRRVQTMYDRLAYQNTFQMSSVIDTSVKPPRLI